MYLFRCLLLTLPPSLPPSLAPSLSLGLRKLTKEHGALLVFDEVMTGFRIAYGGAQVWREGTREGGREGEREDGRAGREGREGGRVGGREGSVWSHKVSTSRFLPIPFPD